MVCNTLFVRSLLQARVFSLVRSPTHLPTHLPTHQTTHPPTHSLTYPSTHPTRWLAPSYLPIGSGMSSPELLSGGRHILFVSLLMRLAVSVLPTFAVWFSKLALLSRCLHVCLLIKNLTMMQDGNFTVTGYNPAMAHNVTGKTLAEDYILFQNLALPNALPFLPSNGTCSSVQSSNVTLAFQCAGSNNISGTGSCCYDTNAAHYQV